MFEKCVYWFLMETVLNVVSDDGGIQIFIVWAFSGKRLVEYETIVAHSAFGHLSVPVTVNCDAFNVFNERLTGEIARAIKAYSVVGIAEYAQF